MGKEKNSVEQKMVSDIPVVNKRKYWYRDDIEVCVLCGREIHNKERVYDKKQSGVYWKDAACGEHFF
jgi:hypothetical protein